jgi:hypothetical protein
MTNTLAYHSTELITRVKNFKERVPDPFLLLSPFSNNLFVRLDESWMDGRAGIHKKYLQKKLDINFDIKLRLKNLGLNLIGLYPNSDRTVYT